MTGMWALGARSSVPQNEDAARSTVEPIRTDSENAEQVGAPEWNERETDESGQLVGLSPRTPGSDTILTEKSPPPFAEFATANHNAIIDNQIASSGTAAAREMAGQRGHGTMQYAIGIDPLNPAERFGNDYFVRGAMGINEGGGDYMTPPDQDNWGSQVAQANANANGRKAYNDSLYRNFFSGVGGVR
jgi:hypothetical protein